MAVVLEASTRVMHRKAHLRGLRGNLEMVEQADEIGVGPVVKYDEPGIHRVPLSLPLHIDGMGMATDPVGGLKYRNLVPAG
ncbi:hypothetical protein D3C81_392010 [compost metagenome]